MFGLKKHQKKLIVQNIETTVTKRIVQLKKQNTVESVVGLNWCDKA